ncbi:MAG: polysaccharide biosynthesis tyrosine autokinase [Deltaproteobacteria bacterium]|nr:polysaccharide biosynthesis tyrosine autokinase [Deltaproteobacteria bacterium]
MADYTIKDVRDITRRRRKTIVIVSVVSALLLFSIILFSKPEPIYEAEAAIKVEKVTTVGELLTGVTKMGDPAITAIAMIRSFHVLEAVAKQAGMIPPNIKTEDVLESPQYMAVIKDMENKILPGKDPRGGNIIIIKTQHTVPATAKKLVSLVAESYRKVAFQERNKNVIEEMKIVANKLAEAEVNMTKSREKLNSYRKSLELTTITDEHRVILDRYIDRKRRVDDLRFRIARINEDIKILKSGLTLNDAKNWIYTPTGENVGIIFALNSTLKDLKIKEDSLLTHYTPLHPEVIAVREQKSGIVRLMITDLEAEMEQHEEEMRVIEDDMKLTYDKLKAIPDAGKMYSILEKDVSANEELYNKILLKQQEVTVKKAEMAEEVSMVSYPVDPKVPINRVTFIGNAIVSFFFAVIIGFIGGFIHEAVDTVPHKMESLAEMFGIPLLTTISDWNKPEMFKLVRNKYPDISDKDTMRYLSLSSHFLSDSAVVEEYRAVVPNLLLMAKESDIKALAILSASGGEGATIFAANLAVSLAQAGRTVALVDANIRSPGIHELFGIKNKPGLTDILMGNYEWENVIRKITDLMLGEIQPSHLLSPAGLDSLYILTSGEKVENPSNFINSKKMETTIEMLRNSFDFVIIDTSPALQSSETSILARKVDAAILLTEYEKLPRFTLLKFRTHMQDMKVKLAGLVLNKSKKTEV